MKIILAILLAFLLTGCANLRNVEVMSSLRASAHSAVGADAILTAGGIMLGAGTEVNPLVTDIKSGVALVGLRLAAVEIANRQPEPQRTTALAVSNAVTWGVVSNNLYVIAAKLFAFLPAGPTPIIVGLTSGWIIWDATEEQRQLATMCALMKETHPNTRC